MITWIQIHKVKIRWTIQRFYHEQNEVFKSRQINANDYIMIRMRNALNDRPISHWAKPPNASNCWLKDVSYKCCPMAPSTEHKTIKANTVSRHDSLFSFTKNWLQLCIKHIKLLKFVPEVDENHNLSNKFSLNEFYGVRILHEKWNFRNNKKSKTTFSFAKASLTLLLFIFCGVNQFIVFQLESDKCTQWSHL